MITTSIHGVMPVVVQQTCVNAALGQSFAHRTIRIETKNGWADIHLYADKTEPLEILVEPPKNPGEME